MATNNITTVPNLNPNDYITIDSTVANTSSYKNVVGYTMNTAAKWDYNDRYTISNELLNELHDKYGGDYPNYASGLIWSRNIMGYSLQIRLKGTPSSADSKYNVNLSVHKTFTVMEKYVYFATDDELTDWFDRHSPVKIIELLAEQTRKLVTELNNFESVLDFELNL